MSKFLLQRKNANLWLLVILLGFFLANTYYYFHGVVYHHAYPLNTFLFDPNDQFADFKNVIYRWFQYLPNEPLPFISYFPFTYLLVGIFRWLALSFSQDFSMLMLFAVFIGSFIKTSLPRLSFLDGTEKAIFLMVTLFFSYPFLFAFDRANFELFVYIFLSFSFFYYQKNKQTPAGIFLGLAAAMKLFPGVLIFIFIFQKKWTAAKATIWSASLATLAALIYLPESIFANVERMLLNMKLFTNLYAINDSGLDFGHSLFGIVKILNMNFGNSSNNDLLAIYSPLVLLMFVGILYFLYRHSLKLWQMLTILVGVMNLFPMVSSNYKLIHLFIPFLFWLNDDSQQKVQPKYWLLWGLLFVPKRYFIFGPYYDGTIIDPILILILFLNIFIDVRQTKAVK